MNHNDIIDALYLLSDRLTELGIQEDIEMVIDMLQTCYSLKECELWLDQNL